MKKILCLLIIFCVVGCVLSGCDKGTKLTVDNYEQYLKVTADCNIYGISCNVTPVTDNYDFNDVEIVVRVTGEYAIYNHIFVGYSASGVPHYDATIKHSDKSFSETFTLRLNIGGTVINREDAKVELALPQNTTTSGCPCEYEVISIRGTVSNPNQ